MGEYATYKGEDIKIGSCESMYYLRADQIDLVQARFGSVDPIKNANELLFRFPFSDENHLEPGDFEDFSRSISVQAPNGLMLDWEHNDLNFRDTEKLGYLIALPCPEGRHVSGPYVKPMSWGNLKIRFQKAHEGALAVTVECAGCATMYTLDEESGLKVADLLERQDNTVYWAAAATIREGYANPPAWVRTPATV